MSNKIIQNKKKGILFWVSGLSGSGKTAIARKIKKRVIDLFGPSIELSGDYFRKIFKLNKYDKISRNKNLWYYQQFSRIITDQNINLIFNLIGMVEKARDWNRKNIDNYIEIYIKADIKKILKKKKKRTYLKFKKNIVGLDIKAEFPKKPHIVIENNFNKSIDQLSDELISKIKKLI